MTYGYLNPVSIVGTNPRLPAPKRLPSPFGACMSGRFYSFMAPVHGLCSAHSLNSNQPGAAFL